MKSKLKPIDFNEDIKRYDAKQEARDVKMPKCRHKELTYDATRAEARCKCGAAWTGIRLQELHDLFSNS